MRRLVSIFITVVFVAIIAYYGAVAYIVVSALTAVDGMTPEKIGAVAGKVVKGFNEAQREE
ncbi:hypothetical protein [Ralstonia phage RSP15]|uniref:hypothetical protein n=1 Tax=Ralstonia phage RSP15 TaxID=1785960 RepID=UPI00074D4654|nr:hypothetical protein BH754_gp157 [Ralstonia phage RSP15]BAU40149.1 hypothetical protein [Ralstonia phage RSP15]